MTTLTVQAVIQAVDHLTGPLKAMAGQLATIQGGLQRTGAAATNFGVLTSTAFLAPLGALATFAQSGQEELDKALRQFQVVATATDEQRKQLRELTMDIGPKLGLPQLQLVKDAQELIQAGLMPEDLFTKGEKGITLFERLAAGSKVADENLGRLSQQLLILAQSFNLPFETSAEKAESLLKVLGLAIAAPRFSPDTPRGHMEALRQFGPLVAPLGVDMNQASALQSVLAKSFPGSLGGMGLKTIFQRLMNPTAAAQQQMMLSGFNYGRVFSFDPAKLGGAEGLINSLRAGGIDASQARDFLAAELGALTPDTDILRFKGDLAAKLGDKLGLKKGNARDRGLLKRGIDNFFTLAQGALNVEALLEELLKLSPAALKDFAGLHHAPKAAVLQTAAALAEYRRILELNRQVGPTAVDEGLAVRTTGYAYALERVRAALTSLRSALWDAGGESVWTAVMTKIGDALLRLARIDPGVLGGIAKWMTIIGGTAAGLAAAGVAMQGLAFGLGGLALAGSRLMAMPLWAKAIAAGGLAALLIGSTTDFFNAGDPWGYGMAANALPGPGAAALAELSRLLGNISSLVGDAVSGISSLFGLDVGPESVLMKSLSALTAALRGVNDGIDKLRQPGLFEGLGDWFNNALPRPPSWWDPFGLKKGSDAGPSVPGHLDTTGGMLGGLGVQPIAKLEGQGEVHVTVTVDGPGRVTGMGVTDDGKNIRLKTGRSMPDTGGPVD